MNKLYVVYDPVDKDNGRVTMYMENPLPSMIVENGLFIDNHIPDPDRKPGMREVVYIDLVSKQLYYQYIEAPVFPPTPTTDEEITLLKAQNAALSERTDFIEDVIAEMATQVYK